MAVAPTQLAAAKHHLRWAVPAAIVAAVLVGIGVRLRRSRRALDVRRFHQMKYTPSAATRRIRSIAPVPGPIGDEMSISPDEHWMSYERYNYAGSELMLVENFQ